MLAQEDEVEAAFFRALETSLMAKGPIEVTGADLAAALNRMAKAEGQVILESVTVLGKLDLADRRFAFGLEFRQCTFKGLVDLVTRFCERVPVADLHFTLSSRFWTLLHETFGGG